MMGATTLGSPDASKGLNGTKKTITDFFGKSPQNSPIVESKPKDLLSYFSKTSCSKNNNNVLQSSLAEELSQLASSPKSHKKSTPVDKPTNSVDSKNKKRKYNGKELLVSSDSPAEDDGVKSKKRKTNKCTDSFQKESSSSVNEKNLSSNLEEENQSGDSKEKAVPNVKKAPGKSVRRSLAKPKRSGGQKNVDELTKPLGCDAPGKDPADDLSLVLCEDISKNADMPQALELSYEEFLLSQESEPEKLEVQTQQTEDELEKLDDTILVSPCQKATKPVSIASFFSQLKKTPKAETPDSLTVTVLADIHPEPRQKPPSPEKKPTVSKSGEIVPKSISLDAKSKLEELDSIVILSTEHSVDVKEIQPSERNKQKSVKKVSSSADRGSKKSAGKGKDSCSASDVKDGKSSQSLLNFGSHKLQSSKPQEELSAIQNINSSKSTLKFPKEKTDISIENPEDNTDKVFLVKVTVDTKTPLKRKRGRSRKNSKVKPEKDETPVNQEGDALEDPKEKTGIKESQMAENGDSTIIDTKAEIPISQEEEKNLGEINSDELEKAKGFPKEVTTDSAEEKSLSNECSLKSNENVPETKENVATTPGTRRSARLRDHKILPPTRYAEEEHSVPVIIKTRKAKKKSVSSPSENSQETSTGKEPNTKQADSEKLAPIFMKKKDKEKEKINNALDMEAIKLRRAFLMSGLTEEAKKQQQTNAVMSIVPPAEYPPIPVENHIQQKPFPEESGNEQESNTDVWNLPEVSLTGLSVSDRNLEVFSLETPEWKCPSSLVQTCKDKEMQPILKKAFSGHRLLSESEIAAAIKILSAVNPSYPVQRFFQMAKARSKNNLKADGESTKPKEKPAEKPKPVPEEPKGRGTTRRSLGRRKNTQKRDIPEENTQKEKEDNMDSPLEDKGCDILWTEKYQPQHSVEVISNCGNLKKLKSWLLEWKQQTDREIRKLNKLLQKQRKNKKSKVTGEDSSSASSWMDDDSNFEVLTSESDDDSLCNTMLLTGPHGVGKTSAIYALAAELGYQVFEVNSSSARSGKKILTQLLEATQSHQVSKDKAELTPVGANLTNQMKAVTSKNPLKKTAPASFAHFFKPSKNSKTDSVPDSKKPETVSGKKRRATLTRTNGVNKTSKTLSPALKLTTKSFKPNLNSSSSNCAFDTPADKMRKQVNISSTSLILFDEVDVVLEEDKGFWAAIQNFMQSTKRPIILTASSADVAEQFGNCCEHLSFRLPSTKVITSHLQTLCLAENVMTDSSEISSLVNYFNGDMRSCLLNLQFWINSGGDLTKHDFPQPSATMTSGSETESSNPSKETLSTENENCLIHRHCLESCLGLNPAPLKMLLNDDLIKPCSDAVSWEDLTSVCHHEYQYHFSLLHQLFPSKLPLPRKYFPPLPNRLQMLQKRNKTKKLGANSSSSWMVDYTANGTLYDSESSLDEPLFISLPKEREDKTDTNSQPISCSQESEASYSASQSVNLQTESTSAEEIVHPEPISELQPQEVNQQRNCENKILSNMAKFYDCCSSNEAFLKSCGYVDLSDALPKYSTATSRSTLTAGLWDELPIEDAKTQRLHLLKENMFDVIANLELRTYVKCLEDISRASEEVISGHEHSISIAPQQQCFGLVNLQSCDPSGKVAHSKAVENVLSNIPLSYGFQHNSLYLDYLPMLREVCRAEKTRQLAKMKRRFFHYFDNIGFPLRESTLNVLANGFT